MELAKITCDVFINKMNYDPSTICYKSVGDYIVMMQKIPIIMFDYSVDMGTQTNENRTNVVDTRYAKFRGDKFFVLLIFHKMDPLDTLNEIVNKYNSLTTIYKIKHVVHSDSFDKNVDNIYSNGIHYFNSIEPAYVYNFDIVKHKYSGNLFYFTDSGILYKKLSYVNSKKEGIQDYFSSVSGKLWMRENFENKRCLTYIYD